MRSRIALVLLSTALLSVAAKAQVPAIKWGPAPAVFPAGIRMAVLQGDPSQDKMFTVRLELPAGASIAPHFHPTEEHVTVISGTFLVGMGDTLNAAKTVALKAGGFIAAPAGMHHYAIARGRTVVQVTAMGPFVLTYVNPKDQPQAPAGR